MNLTDRFKNAYHALVDAYYNDTLFFGSCAACAVGSICARANGYKITIYDEPVWMDSKGKEQHPKWSEIRFLDMYLGEEWLFVASEVISSSADKEVFKTGYSTQELFEIEKRFFFIQREHGTNTFETLCKTIDMLLELDGMGPLEELHTGFEMGQDKAHELIEV